MLDLSTIIGTIDDDETDIHHKDQKKKKKEKKKEKKDGIMDYCLGREFASSCHVRVSLCSAQYVIPTQ